MAIIIVPFDEGHDPDELMSKDVDRKHTESSATWEWRKQKTDVAGQVKSCEIHIQTSRARERAALRSILTFLILFGRQFQVLIVSFFGLCFEISPVIIYWSIHCLQWLQWLQYVLGWSKPAVLKLPLPLPLPSQVQAPRVLLMRWKRCSCP